MPLACRSITLQSSSNNAAGEPHVFIHAVALFTGVRKPSQAARSFTRGSTAAAATAAQRHCSSRSCSPAACWWANSRPACGSGCVGVDTVHEVHEERVGHGIKTGECSVHVYRMQLICVSRQTLFSLAYAAYMYIKADPFQFVVCSLYVYAGRLFAASFRLSCSHGIQYIWK